MSTVRVAVAQLYPHLADSEGNLRLCLDALGEAAGQGAALAVLPEAALTGYVYDSAADAHAAALDADGPELAAVAERCSSLRIHAVVGLLQRDGERVRNACVLFGPGGPIATYKKTHLPYLGVDRFVTPGAEPFDVYETPVGRLGLEICFDLRFPEQTRALALAGADIVCHPTNWPVQAGGLADFMTRARAVENRVFLLTANRVGEEAGARFCGLSQIVSPAGERLAIAGPDEETVLVADVDLEEARTKTIVAQAGSYEMPLWSQRRPELYGRLAEPTG
jgi:predicted amidohydrolase